MNKDKLAKIKALMTERDLMVGKLERSLAIAEIWPEAFDHGKANGWIQGSPSQGFKYYVTNGKGETREWELDEVPEVLTKDFKEMRRRAFRNV